MESGEEWSWGQDTIQEGDGEDREGWYVPMEILGGKGGVGEEEKEKRRKKMSGRGMKE